MASIQEKSKQPLGPNSRKHHHCHKLTQLQSSGRNALFWTIRWRHPPHCVHQFPGMVSEFQSQIAIGPNGSASFCPFWSDPTISLAPSLGEDEPLASGLRPHICRTSGGEASALPVILFVSATAAAFGLAQARFLCAVSPKKPRLSAASAFSF